MKRLLIVVLSDVELAYPGDCNKVNKVALES